MSDLSDLPPHAWPVDLTMLPELTGCDDAMRDEFLGDFLPVLRHERADMAQAFVACDPAAIEVVAHRLKSAARYVGALALGDLCDALEQASQLGQLAACLAQRPAWSAEAERVEAFLIDHLGAPAHR